MGKTKKLKTILTKIFIFITLLYMLIQQLTVISIAKSFKEYEDRDDPDKAKAAYAKDDGSIQSTKTTVMGVDYDFYMQRTAETKIYRNLRLSTGDYSEFVIASTPNADGTYSKSLTSGQYFAWFRKIGKYKGEDLDVKISLMDYKLTKGLEKYSKITFADSMGSSVTAIEYVDMKIEFYEHDDSIKIDDSKMGVNNTTLLAPLDKQTKKTGVKGFYTITDIDSCQGVIFKDKNVIQQTYVTNGNKHLRHLDVTEGSYFFTMDNTDYETEYKTWLTATFDTKSSNAINLIHQYPQNNVTGAPEHGQLSGATAGMGNSSHKVVPTEIPTPKKMVTDSDEEYVKENELKTATETFTYSIEHTIPFEGPEFYYNSYELTDNLPKGLTYVSASVTDETGATATGGFNISTSGSADTGITVKFEIKDNIIKTSSPYNKTFTYNIKVKGKSLNALRNEHYNKETGNIEMKNSATITIEYPNYVLPNDGKLSVEYTDKSVKTNDVITKLPIGQIKIIKKDAEEQSKTLEGAEFGIYTDQDCTKEKTTVTTKANGEVTTWVEKGTYWIKEITSPEGYIKNTDVKKVTVNGNDTQEVTILNQREKGNISIKKIDSVTRAGLSGVRIGIYEDNNCEKVVETLTTGNNGTVTSSKLVAGSTYYIKELEGLQNYVIDQTVKTVTIDENSTQNIEIENIPYGNIQVVKTNKVTGENLQGAVIGIFNEAGEKVDEVTTGSDGTATTKKLIPNKNYTIRETSAPNNFVLDSQSYTVRVEPGKTVRMNESIKNTPYGNIGIKKVDQYTNEPLVGATFNIYSDSGCTNVVQSLTTDGAGSSKTNTPIEPTTYYIKEVTAPANYVLNTNVYPITVEPGLDSVTNLSESIPNRPNTATVQVSKLDELTNNIVTKEDTTFALYEWSASTGQWVKPTHLLTNTFNGTTTDGNAYVLKSTGSKGTYSGTIYYNASNQGKFKIEEYTRPYGYTTSHWSTEVQITRDGQTFTFNSQVKNKQVRGTINFKKNDKEVNHNNSSYGETYAQGDATLEGAVYGLYAREDILSPDTGSVLYSRGQLVKNATTDQYGKITWEELYLGKYYVKEITASRGYLVDSTEYNVDIDAYYREHYFTPGDQTTERFTYENTVADAQYSNPDKRVISKEQVKKQSFQLTKLGLSEDSTMGEPLQGAGFKIYLIKDLSGVKNGNIRPDSNGNYKAEDFLRI